MWAPMKLTRLYSNKPEIFTTVDFIDGINVVLAEIRVPENRNKDTHNLGKTTLGRILDFCLLSKRNPKIFLFKHKDLFKEFVFFLEIELLNGTYLTIRRSVNEASKIAFKSDHRSGQDFSLLDDKEWDHANVPFERAKTILDGLLDLGAVKPWPFRKGLGYLLRSQRDFHDVFQLQKFAGNHADWKPYLAQLLGFNASNVIEHYDKESKLDEKKATEKTIEAELGGSVEDLSEIEGRLLLKDHEVEMKQSLLDAFDFRAADIEKTKSIVDEFDDQIAALNAERYSMNFNRKKIIASLEEDKILFNPNDAEQLFAEAGVIFPGQVKKDFEQLISFNRAITDERRTYLREELIEVETALRSIGDKLDERGKLRSEALSYLSETDVFNKYRKVSDDLVSLKADVTTLDRQRVYLQRLQTLRKEIRKLDKEKTSLQAKIEDDVEKQNSDKKSLFSSIRLYFSEIIKEVIDRDALLTVAPNRKGHLDFSTEILDESGNATSADMGYTYRKLLCMAFDMAVLRAHLNQQAPRFIYHDGVFESLDNRIKMNLLAVMRKYTDVGIQLVITLIDSDLPQKSDEEEPFFDESEIVLLLHDEGEDGRLFKMSTW
jgi:uncharacterized protein YydD (DUF2326 family)